MYSRITSFAVSSLLFANTVACLRPADDRPPLELAEAAQALEATTEANEAGDLLNASAEISTHFTLGQAARDAAEELRSFVESQLPCAEITVDEGTLRVQYGAKPGTCTYRGQTFSGEHAMTLVRFDTNGAEVRHEWTKFSNGNVEVDGTATVTWTMDEASFHAVERYDWTRLRTGKRFTAEAEQTVGGLDGDFARGFTWDGQRSWNGEPGAFSLNVDGVAARWIDPVPQTGTMTIENDRGQAVDFTFRRVDEDTIRVTLTGGGKSYAVDVHRLAGAGELTEE